MFGIIWSPAEHRLWLSKQWTVPASSLNQDGGIAALLDKTSSARRGLWLSLTGRFGLGLQKQHTDVEALQRCLTVFEILGNLHCFNAQCDPEMEGLFALLLCKEIIKRAAAGTHADAGEPHCDVMAFEGVKRISRVCIAQTCNITNLNQGCRKSKRHASSGTPLLCGMETAASVPDNLVLIARVCFWHAEARMSAQRGALQTAVDNLMRLRRHVHELQERAEEMEIILVSQQDQLLLSQLIDAVKRISAASEVQA